MPRFQTRVIADFDKNEMGDTCCYHPERDATHVIVTEFSAFGNEEEPVCEECKTEYIKGRTEPQNKHCSRCNRTDAPDVFAWRDPEEGSSGAYIDTCKQCRS